MWDISINVVLKARREKSLSDTCSAMKLVTVRDVVFQLLRYQKLVSSFPGESDMDLGLRKEKTTEAQEKLLKSGV